MLPLVRSWVRSLWHLPAPADTRPPGSTDYVVVLLAGSMALVEAALLRPDMSERWLALAAFGVWLPTLLVRRTNPLLMAVVFAVVTTALLLTEAVTGIGPPDDLHTAVVALLMPFSLARWATGRDAILGLGLFVLIAGTSLATQYLSAADRIGGASVIVAAAAIGATLRARAMLRTRQLDDVRQSERERLARDLHDTVAHHLTAIAITAQAGLAVTDGQPGAATDALRRIDEEATRTLAETRKVLRLLRTEDDPPERPLDDLAGLASPGGPGPVVDLELAPGLDALPPTTAAAVHRIAQEAIANCRRHATGATRVQVRVTTRGTDVEVTVIDDGAPTTRQARGFGIVGMNERATLLGGTLEAGPAEPGGWRVRAVLPLEDVR